MKLLLMSCLMFSSVLYSQSIKTFTKDLSKTAGFFSIYYNEEESKVYLEKEKDVDEFIMLSSLPYGVGSNDIGLDRGLQGGSRLVELKRVGKRVLLIQKNTDYRASTNNQNEKNAVNQAFAVSVLASFPIVAENSKNNFLIEVTDFILDDHMEIQRTIKQRGQGAFKLDKKLSAVDETVMKSFPNNTELQTILTFTGNDAGSHLKTVTPDNEHVSVRQRVSWIRLPDDNYQMRRFHPQSGLLYIDFVDYGTSISSDKTQRFIRRHRLQKKHPNKAQSIAIEPIIYYVDNGAPEPIKSALLEGARWWNDAFTEAGFINGFQVAVLPDGVDPMDARYNVIQWVHRATRGWSYGSSITDPRTGEIIKGHVTLGSLRVRQDLMIASGLTNPYADNDVSLVSEMALDRIRQLSAHEVGHTIGFAHNFSASVNDRASVMDYPHPLVSVVQNKISLENAYAKGIGRWDIQTVKYGYSEFSLDEEKQALADIISESKKQGLKFISDQDARAAGGLNAEAHLWDNGTSALEELGRVIHVRKIALENFSKNVIADGVPYSELEEVLVPIYNFHRYQIEATAKLIGGRYYQYAVKGEDEFIQQPVSYEQQNKALAVLLKTLEPEFLSLPTRLIEIIPPKAYGYKKSRESFKGYTGLSLDPLSIAESSADHTFSMILNTQRLARIAQSSWYQHPDDKKDQSNRLKLLLKKMTKQLIAIEKGNEKYTQLHMRVLNRYINHLLSAFSSEKSPIEVKAAIIAELDSLDRAFKRELTRLSRSDNLYGYYRAMRELIESGLSQEFKAQPANALPPGSPIG